VSAGRLRWHSSWMLRSILIVGLLCTSVVRAADPSASLYHLDARLTDQSGRAQGLDVHRGHPVLVTLFYSGCLATCPLIIDTLRSVERELPAAERARLRVLMISIDSEHDTPAALRTLAQTRRIDLERWTLARADSASVRKIAAALGVQYRSLPDGGFNHSTVIALLSPLGEITASTSRLGTGASSDLFAVGSLNAPAR
jgi:protein SCO1